MRSGGGSSVLLHLIFGVLVCLSVTLVKAEDPYRFYTWTVTYGTISPLGVPQQVILINGQFPGPRLDIVTNDNIIINVFNKLDQPFLLTWNGIKQRKNSWQDGVLGTNCPIPPNSNYTYKIQAKDQIGTYTYFPSTAMHKVAGGFGGINIYARPRIPVPYPLPTADFTLLIGDWYKTNHKVLQQLLDSGKAFPLPDGLLINGQTRSSSFSGDQGKTYMFRISNVGLSTSINFRIQGHKMKLVECEGSHTIQNFYDSLDVHVGQSLSVLVTLDQPPKDYYIVASTRFTRRNLTTTAVLHYSNSQTAASGPLPMAPTLLTHWSMKQARTFRRNLTANAARPNPQGSYHYGSIKTSRTIILANSAPMINGKQRYAVNRVSYVNADTPLKLADYFNITGVFSTNTLLQSPPPDGPASVATSVILASLHEFIEIVFQNNEKEIQSWHIDGHDFWVVGYGSKQWTPDKRKAYNLVDADTRHTVQVYPNSWTAVMMSLENQGMWNIRSAMWARQYLGQQFYLRVWNPIPSLKNEYDIPPNALLCGKATGRHT
ncbi:Multicopper oxidase [Macleaya cordata]|uniref:Multicopper oxidase n=1 Tax=Macleaya cordata TaxID=56857 RepID=A0A200QQR4_MACCD|nr:Multicopper oxidase [Macleaya cordata]